MTEPRDELEQLTEVQRPRQLAVKVRKAAELIDIGPSKMYDLVNRGAIPSIRVDGAIRIPVDGLRDWVKEREEHGNETAP